MPACQAEVSFSFCWGSMKVFILGVLAVFLASGCAASGPPQFLVASIEWHSQAPGGPFVWQEFSRTGKVRGSPDASSKEFSDYMYVEEKNMPEKYIARVWQSAGDVVLEQKASSDAALWPGEGHEQVVINFCHSRFGWQTLSLVWPAGQEPPSKTAQRLLQLLRDKNAAARENSVKAMDLLTEPSIRLAASRARP